MEHADPLIGRVLDGRYRVGARVARGGMAVVHEAVDLRLDRVVAVKVMHPGLGEDPDFVARFEREARSAAKLAHPHAVAVFDQGDDHGTLFLVMEYVPGMTLRELIRREAPLPPRRALALLDPVLQSLAAAHRAGMIHRDVKPENVLLGEDNGQQTVKVADFGLARAVNAETQHTATSGVLIGTVSYLAPELVVDGRADPRADVYAAGVILYELLTGQKPHQAESPIQVAYKHVHEDVPAPSRRVPDIPDYVDALVERATARDPSLRPADAGVLLHQVRRVRQALDQGVRSDEELTADLALPQHEPTDELPDFDSWRPDPGQEGTEVLPAAIIDPSATGAATAWRAAHAGAAEGAEGPGYRPPRSTELAMQPLPPPSRRQRRRGPLLLVGLVVLIALVALGGWYLGIARYTVTPGVVNLPRDQAQARITHAGLRMRVSGTAYSEDVAKGAVVRSDPGAGERILKHGLVSVVLSRGPERHRVPRLAGMSLDQARAALDDAHLAFGRALSRYSETVPLGEVIRSDPPADTLQRRNTAVDLEVSKGPRPIRIPDLTGKPAAAARARLEKLGFDVTQAGSEYSDSVPKGHVITQSPDQGTGHRGDTITLVVSRGPELVSVPDVRRESYDQAKAELQALGLKVRREDSALYIGFDRVAGMDPAPGTQVPKGTTITLQLV
ncbi:MAG: Stk1 family PASTA domain-containing Ser/Thr kinase [Marmoricola sp.]